MQLLCVTESNAKVRELENMIQQLQAPHTSGRATTGSTYIRWGRTTCPSGTGARVLYDGYAGGSWFDHSGGGSNHLCLPRDPDLVNIEGGTRSYMYGAEYETHDTDHRFVRLHDEKVPCVVCFTPNTNVVMIPAKSTCHADWVLEYNGFLMSDQYLHRRTDYVCMDSEAVGHNETQGNLNGAVFYFVEAKCGALPCGPYIDGYELTCAVCSLPPVTTYNTP